MRIVSIITALAVIAGLYLFVFERDAVLGFASGGGTDTAQGEASESGAQAGTAADTGATGETDGRVPVIALRSHAREIDSAVLLRGRTQASRQVELRAEASGQVVSDPLRKGVFVEQGALLCRLDPGTSEIALAEAQARLAEALSRVPEAEARLAEAQSQVPAVQAALGEARARVPEAEARLAEAQSRVPAMKASLVQAEANLPAAEARVAEAEARLKEAQINFNAAERLSEGGFASDTRVANAEAALSSARAGVEGAKSALEGARAAVQSAKSQVEGAAAGVISAQASVEGAKAAIQSAVSRVDGAAAGVQSARSGVQNAKAGVQSAEAAVAGAERAIENLVITAPFAGFLESDSAELGSLLQPGALCATIVQIDPIRMVGFVSELEVNKVSTGVPAGGRLADGRELIGRVTFVSRAADPTTRTFRVDVEVPNPDFSLRDGQTAEIVISAAGRMAHLLPQSALTLDNEGDLGVRVADGDDIARFVPVEVLRDSVEGVWVSGLEETADVIVVGHEYVSDGVPLKVTLRETAP